MKPTESNICPVHNRPMNYHANGKPCCKPQIAHLCQATPPPSEPLGVAAVTHPRPEDLLARWDVRLVPETGVADVLQGEDVVLRCAASDARTIVQWHNDTLPATPTREPAEGATPLSWGVEESDRTLWVGPMRSDGEKINEIVCAIDIYGLTEEATNRKRQQAHLIAQSVNYAGPQSNTIRTLETSLAEAKARLAEKENNLLDKNAEIRRDNRHIKGLQERLEASADLVSVLRAKISEKSAEAKARLAEALKVKQSFAEAPCIHEWYQERCCNCAMDAKEFRAAKKAHDFEAGRSAQSVLELKGRDQFLAHLRKTEIEPTLAEIRSLQSKLSTATAENERLAALVAKTEATKHEIDSEASRIVIAKDNQLHDLRAQLTAAQAQIAAKDSLIEKIDEECGQAENMGALPRIQKLCQQALSPSCGAELREELDGYKASERTLAQFLGKIAEVLGLPPCDPPEILHVVKGLAARIAKLEGALRGLMDSDDICKATDEELQDAVENGFAAEIKQQAAAILAARQALDSAQEGRGA